MVFNNSGFCFNFFHSILFLQLGFLKGLEGQEERGWAGGGGLAGVEWGATLCQATHRLPLPGKGGQKIIVME